MDELNRIKRAFASATDRQYEALGREEEPDAEDLLETVVPKERVSTWIPQHIQGVYEDTDGIDHAAIIVALTGGVTNNDSSKLEVAIVDNGQTVVVGEEWSEEMLNMDLFYSNVEMDPDESHDDIHLRRFAMIKAVRKKSKEDPRATTLKSSWYSRIPFQADPATLRYKIFGNEEGSRFLHIDVTEKKRIKIDRVTMMTKTKTIRTPKKAKLSTYN